MARTYPKTCERCGTGFECGLSRCWCGQIPVDDQQYDRIVRQYHDCLCPGCLAELTETPPSSTPPSVPS
ncbi:MAG: cysteine-rich CWC family protein [Nitrospirales bacterium]